MGSQHVFERYVFGRAPLPPASHGGGSKLGSQLVHRHQLLVLAQSLSVIGHVAPEEGAFLGSEILGVLVGAVAALPVPAFLALR